MQDEVLIKGLRRGLITAQERFFKTYKQQVYNQCYGILKDYHDAEEAAQMALYRAIANINKFDRKAALQSWVYRIAFNECCMMLRRRKQHDRRRVAFAPYQKLMGYKEMLDDPYLREQIFEAYSNLDNSKKVVFILAGLKQEDQDTASKSLGITIPAYKSRLHRTMRDFKKAVGYDPT